MKLYVHCCMDCVRSEGCDKKAVIYVEDLQTMHDCQRRGSAPIYVNDVIESTLFDSTVSLLGIRALLEMVNA